MSSISFTLKSIGDYKISDQLVETSVLTSAMDNISSSVNSLQDDVTSLQDTVAETEATLNLVSLSVDQLSTKTDSIIVDLNNVIDTLGNHDEYIDYLSGVVSALNLKALRHTITDVGILRPTDPHNLLLRVSVFGTKDMATPLGEFDMSSTSDWKYFKALFINNEDSSEDPTIDSLTGYFSGTQWVTPLIIDSAIKEYGSTTGFQGYGPAFNNAPVNISFLQWLDDNGKSTDLSLDSRFFLRYEWYYTDSEGEHTSDHFSMMVPSYSEVGAKAGATVSKSELYELKQALETRVATAHYMTDEEIEALAAAGSRGIGLVDYSTAGYYVQPYQCTILEDFATNTESVKKIILENYSEGKTYKLKFTTGSSKLTVGVKGTPRIQFQVNYGYGPENNDDLNASSIVFEANTTYLIALNLGMIQVIAKN